MTGLAKSDGASELAATHEADASERTSSAMFGAVGVALLTVCYMAMRRGFPNPLQLPITASGIALLILCGPLLAHVTYARRKRVEPPWWLSQPLLMLSALLLTAVTGTFASLAGPVPGAIVAGAGWLCAVVATTVWFRSAGLRKILVVAGFAVLWFSWAGGVAWSTRYKSPTFPEAVRYRGNVHHDPLFNVAVARMMQNYGVPSTGLDGVPYVPYHYGASWLHAQWADLARTDVLTFYNVGPALIMIPLFGAALLLLVVEIRAALRRRGRSPPRALEGDYLAGAILLAATVGVVPSIGLDAVGIWNRHLLISESYISGLPIFVLGLASLLAVFERSRNSRMPLPFLFIVFPLLVAALGFLKVSLMILTLGAAGWAALRLGLLRQPVILITAMVALLVAGVTYKLVSLPSQNQGIVPFAYMRLYVRADWWPYFVLVHLFWSWLYVFARVWEERAHTLGELVERIRARRLLDAELVLVVAVAGFIPGEILNIHGGSAFYLSDVQRWLSVPLLMAAASMWFTRTRRSNPIGRIALMMLSVPFVLAFARNAVRAPAAAIDQNVELRRDLYSLAGVNTGVPGANLSDPRILAAGLDRGPRNALVSALLRSGAMTREEQGRTLLFIPQSDTAFWYFYPERDRCMFAPFAGPAISGLALLDGIPPPDCPATTQYAYTQYATRTRHQVPADTLDASLCSRAAPRGFFRVKTLGNAPDYRGRVVECPRGARS